MSKSFVSMLIAALAALPLAAGAATTTYTFNLNGAAEVPPNGSPAAGSFLLTLDDMASTITFSSASFSLMGAVTGAHIHDAAAGSSGPVVYGLLGVADTAGPLMIGPFALPSSFGFAGTGKPIAPLLISDINAAPWDYYVNIHTTSFPGGEIRGQLAPVPEPGTYALLAIGLGVIGVAARRRRTA